MNKVVLIGRLTNDPTIKYKEFCMAKFSLAVNKKFTKDKNNAVEDKNNAVDFIKCAAFRNTAQFIEKYLKKGSKIAVFGRLHTKFFEDKNGYKVNLTEVIVDELEFAESPKSKKEKLTPEQKGDVEIPDEINDEDLPF